GLTVAAGAAHGGAGSIRAQDLREWLTYIASDDLQGRAVYTAGLGLAAGYIEQHLQEWGLKPAGDRRSFLHAVPVVGGEAASRPGNAGPQGIDQATYRRLLGGRNRYATEQLNAAASLGPEPERRGPGTPAGGAAGAPAGGGQAGGGIPAVDFTTTQRLDRPIPP